MAKRKAEISILIRFLFFPNPMGLREYNNLQGQKKWVLIRIN